MVADLRAVVLERVRDARPALDEAVHAHVRALEPGPSNEDVHYEVGQYSAVEEAISFGLDGIDHPDAVGQVPPAPLAQARRAARRGVPLDTLLRRYFAGVRQLVASIKHEIDQLDVVNQEMAMAMMLALHDRGHRLTAAVAAEYGRETAREISSPAERRVELVRDLLAGAISDPSELGYRMDGVWHICVIAVGSAGERAVAALATALNRSLLRVAQSDTLVFAWLGGPRRIQATDIDKVRLGGTGQGLTIAVSEPLLGLEGWRLACRQAQAAVRVALIEQRPIAHFADVALVAPFLADADIARAIVALFLGPLNQMRDGGESARETLRAYFNAGGQLLAAADTLEVDRHTVPRRIEAMERQLGYPVFARHAEIDLALRLEAALEAWPAHVMQELTRQFGMAPV